MAAHYLTHALASLDPHQIKVQFHRRMGAGAVLSAAFGAAGFAAPALRLRGNAVKNGGTRQNPMQVEAWWRPGVQARQAAAGRRAALAEAIVAASPHPRALTRPEAGSQRMVAANEGYRRLVEQLGLDGLPVPAVLFASDMTAMAAALRLPERVPPEGAVSETLHLNGRSLRLTLMVRPDEPAELIWDIADSGVEELALRHLAEQRDALAAFLDNAPVGLYSVAPDGRFLFTNRTFAAWAGTVPEKLSKARLSDVLARSEGDGVPMTPDWEGGEARLKNLGPKALLSALRLVGVTQRAVPGMDGSPERYSAVVHDLSRELRLRGTLRPVEAEFRRFFEQAPIGILVLDANGAILDGNAAFAAMRGAGLAGQGDVIGQRLAALVREEDGAELNRHLMAVRRGEAVARPLLVRIPAPAQGMGGAARERSVEIFAASLDADADSQAAQLVYLVDMTDQRSLQAQFNQSQKMQAVGQLAGGIAHDFNNLLTAMIGFCDLLLQRLQPGEQSFADVMQIKQNANRAANLVRQLLAFSRQQTLVPRVLDVGDVLADLRNLIGRLIGETIHLRMNHGRDLGLVKVDRGQLEQVIVNLAVNARDAMIGGQAPGQGSELLIRTANHHQDHPVAFAGETMPPGDYVLIEVADTGHGIAPENMAKIFDPFFTTKAVGAGTGLGLSTVYGIIKQTGGFIQVESQTSPAPNTGTTFRIYLPRHQAGPEARAEAREEAVVAAGDLTGQGLVLLVEDEEAVRAFAARALRNKGYTVIEAASGDQALELPEEQLNRVEVLISDVVMPGIDGPALAAALRERRKALKILFISGYAEDSLRQSMTEGEGVHFLPKPFSLGQLAGKLKEVIEQS